MSDKICGRDWHHMQPVTINKTRYRHKSYAKIIVDGINHPKGKPIRFRSKENAERHIRNMGLEIKEV